MLSREDDKKCRLAKKCGTNLSLVVRGKEDSAVSMNGPSVLKGWIFIRILRSLDIFADSGDDS